MKKVVINQINSKVRIISLVRIKINDDYMRSIYNEILITYHYL